jgi:hypothetical protein
MGTPQIDRFASSVPQSAEFGLAAEILTDQKAPNRGYQKATALFGVAGR